MSENCNGSSIKPSVPVRILRVTHSYNKSERFYKILRGGVVDCMAKMQGHSILIAIRPHPHPVQAEIIRLRD